MTFEDILNKFGYVKRTEGYYIHREHDGYINISPPFKGTTGYSFHKNFYTGIRNPHYKGTKYNEFTDFLGFECLMGSNTITYNTEDINEFYNFMLSFRNIERFKLNKKLKKIRGITNILTY